MCTVCALCCVTRDDVDGAQSGPSETRSDSTPFLDVELRVDSHVTPDPTTSTAQKDFFAW